MWQKDMFEGTKLKKLQNAMRATAELAARAGANGINPAIQLLKMAGDEEFQRKAQLVRSKSRRWSNDPEPPSILKVKRMSSAATGSDQLMSHESIDHLPAAVLAQLLTECKVAKSEEWRLKVAYRLLSEGLSQPWPNVAVQLLSINAGGDADDAGGCSPSMLKAFAGCVPLTLHVSLVAVAHERDCVHVQAPPGSSEALRRARHRVAARGVCRRRAGARVGA
jgi:hypothetical protein